MTTIVETESPTAALARIVKPLDAGRAATLKSSFGVMFDQCEAWHTEAKNLVVTSEEQTGKMERARLLRLEIRKARVALDKKRKELKEHVLIEGRAIDGAYNVFEGLAAPLEKLLLEQETFAERAAKARQDALRDARQEALTALGVVHMPAELGQLDQAAWNLVLTDAVAAKRARDEQAKLDAARAEETRLLAAKTDAQVRAENEKLRAAAKARDAEEAAARARVEVERKAEREKAKADQMAAEKKAADERAAREKAEQVAAQLRKDAEDKAAREAETKKPTKAKYGALIEALRAISLLEGGDPRSRALALAALAAVGEIALAPTVSDPLGLDEP